MSGFAWHAVSRHVMGVSGLPQGLQNPRSLHCACVQRSRRSTGHEAARTIREPDAQSSGVALCCQKGRAYSGHRLCVKRV
jgi:hypothetical protein